MQLYVETEEYGSQVSVAFDTHVSCTPETQEIAENRIVVELGEGESVVMDGSGPKGRGERPMRLSYNKLWKLLIDNEMNKSQLQSMSGISTSTMAKLGRGGNVQTDVLLRICETLECDIADIVAVAEVHESQNEGAHD